MLGFAVALSFDGHTLVTSAFDERGSGRTINGPRDNTAGGAERKMRSRAAMAHGSSRHISKDPEPKPPTSWVYVVAISDDGNTVAAGAGDEDCLTPGINPPGCDNDSPPRGAANIWVGAAHVFVRSGTTWTEQAFIKANNPRPYNSFGVKLALSGDGNTLAVTAHLEDNAAQGVRAPEPQPFLIVDHLDPWREQRNQAEESGAAYFYTRSGATWTQRAT